MNPFKRNLLKRLPKWNLSVIKLKLELPKLLTIRCKGKELRNRSSNYWQLRAV